MSYAGLQKIEAGAVVARAHPDLPSFENVMSDIGALPMFSGHQGKSYGVPRGQEFPALLLSVCDVSPAGEHEVFDISVDSLHSFTANGVVVHNCDNKFHTEPLNELLESDEKFGFIIMDGSGTLFGTLAGNSREVLHRFTVDLPKKHGRGGQSALRFARLRMEKRHNYVRKVAEMAVQFYITNDRPNVTGLVLAGLADFKTELSASDMFDPRLQAIIMKVVDVSYGGDNGFNQAIEMAAEVLANVKFIREKKLISQFFDEIAQDSGKYCFGVDDTLKALELGAVETLLVWENLESQRFVVKNATGEEKVLHLTKEQLTDSSHFREAGTNAELEVQEQMALLEWFANNYKRFGAKLEIVTNRSQEGSQFCKGFGGIGGLLRYRLDLQSHDPEDDFNDINYDEDDY